MHELMTADEYNRLREYIDIQLLSLDKARQLQAKEYERRMENLNHETEQLKAMQQKYIRRETYDQKMDNIEKDLRELRDYRSNQEGRQTVILFGFGLIVTVLNIGIGIFLHFLH
jgi:hypothetical protein